MSIHVKLLTTNLIHEIKENDELANIYIQGLQRVLLTRGLKVGSMRLKHN